MATSSQPPLDELQYRRPEIIEWWVNEGGQAMDENMLHRYISESPFFDYTTKNGLVIDQSRTNIAAYDLTRSRRAFEDSLSKQKGSEYMIVNDDQSQIAGSPGGGLSKNGVWNIRKQYRDGNRTADGRFESLETLSTYYIVGENMYQAPSVADVVGNRLLSAATSLSKFFDTAANLPSFSPTTGYTYLPHTTKPTATSTAGSTPSHSREGSVVPGVALDTQSLRSGSLAPPDSQAGAASNTSAQDARLLASSLKMALEFSDEYTDENPIIGEPGHFSFTSSTAAVKKRKLDEEAARTAAETKAKNKTDTAGVKTPLQQAAKVPEPPAVFTEAKTTATAIVKGEKDRDRRGSKIGEKIKRKKSKAANVAGSPTTPKSGGGALPPSTG